MAVKPKLNPKGVNANDTMQDSVITHAINLERLKAGETASVKNLLDDLEIDIQKRLEKIDPTGVGTTYRARRLAVLLKQVKATIKKNFSKVAESNADTLKEVSKASAKATVNSINKALRVNLGATLPSASVLNNLHSTVLLQGDVVKSYWEQQSFDLASKFTKQMRMGIASGDSVPTLIQRVRGTKDANFTNGIMNVSRRNAEALVRSSVSAVNNASAIETIGANQDIMNGYQWLATLDSRTSDVCKARSGLVWDLDFQPVGHSIAWSAPPAHFNCRSTVIGLLKPWNEISNKPLPEVDKDTYKEQLTKAYKAKGLSNVATLSALRRTQSSMDGYVAGDINFEDWLRKKPVKFQKEILGDDKWELWNNKKIGFVDLVNQNSQPRSLAELKALVEKGRTSVLKKNKRARVKAKQEAEADLLKTKLAKKAEEDAQAFIDDLIAGIGGVNQLKVFKKLVDEKAVTVNDLPVFVDISAVEVKALVQAGVDEINTASYISSAKKKLESGKKLSPKEITAWNTVDPDVKKAFTDNIEAKKQAILESDKALKKLVSYQTGGKGLSVFKQAYEKLDKQKKLTGDFVADVKAVELLKDELQQQASLASVKTGIKKKFAVGKPLSKKQQEVFDDLDVSEQETLMQAGKGFQTVKQQAKEQAVKAEERSKGLIWEDLEQIGGQQGSNLGGKFRSKVDGQVYYIKSPRTDDHVLNEQVANNLYKLLGVKVPDVQTMPLPKGAVFRDGTAKTNFAVVSKWTDDLVQETPDVLAKASGTYDNFGADAWLANWDVVGTGYDNLKLLNGTAFRVDAGGALKYRAMGDSKGAGWGKEVFDIDTLRDAKNEYNYEVFKDISQTQIAQSVQKVVALPDSAIRKAVYDAYDFDNPDADELIEILLARKKTLEVRFEKWLSKQKPARLPPSEVLDEVEYQNIKNSRINGYSVATDKDQIEDQQVLLHHITDDKGKRKTILTMKVRGDTQKRLDKLTIFDQRKDEYVEFFDLDIRVMTAIKGIRSRLDKGLALNNTDIDRIDDAIKVYEKYKYDLLKTNDYIEMIGKEGLQKFNDEYDPFIEELIRMRDIATQQSVGQKWSLTEDFKGLQLLKIKKELATTKWKKDSGTWKRNSLEKSNATRETINVEWNGSTWKWNGGRKLNEKDHNIRYFSSDATIALRGLVHIEVDGDDIHSAVKALGIARKTLGINMDKTTLLDREELYLWRYLYIIDHKKVKEVTERTKGLSQADTIAELKATVDMEALNKFGKTITDNPNYMGQLDGEWQAFGHGRKHQVRIDLAGKEWEDFVEDTRIIHKNTSGSYIETFKNVIDGGGQMAPTMDKMRRGINIGGMSPEADMDTGGSSYFFTRLRQKNRVSTYRGVFVWKSDQLKRIDAQSFRRDVFGRTDDSTLSADRRTNIEGMKKNRDGDDRNETNFKDGLSLFDGLESFIVSTQEEVEVLVKFMNSRGYKQWVDGRKLEDVIITSAMADKRYRG